MDTNRLKIINQDLSGGTASTVDTLKGFTVVEAGKGPIVPIFIPANNTAMIHDVLGYPSEDYPHIQEVLDFNASYGLYVSAPYDTTKNNAVPVAYMTPAGVFSRETAVSLGESRVEDIEIDEAQVEGINVITNNPTILVPVGREARYFGTEGVEEDEVLGFSTGGDLEIKLAFDISKSKTDKEATAHFLASAFDTDESQVMKRASTTSGVLAELVFDIPGEAELITLRLADDDASYLIQDSTGKYICTVASETGSKIVINAIDDRDVALSAVAAKYFSKAALAATWSSDAFRKGVRVYWRAELKAAAVHASIYPKYLSERVTSLSFAKQALGNRITIVAEERVAPTSVTTKTVVGSILPQDRDGYGASLYFQDVLTGQHLINVAPIKSFEGVVYTKTKSTAAPVFLQSPVILSRGKRFTEDALEIGWQEAADAVYDNAEVFFYPEALDAEAESKFFELADTHKVSRFVASIIHPPVNETLPALSYGSSYFIITNQFSRKNSYTKQNVTTPLVGAYSAMIVRAIEYKLGGAAPMFLNSGGVGGQLNINVRKAINKYNKTQLSLLDAAGYNPIILDPSYGVMVVGQKTAKGGELSDWSFIGHASSFLYFMREARDTVMIPQIGKHNNPYYREQRQHQTEGLLSKRTDGIGRIWAAATCDTSEETVNTPEVQAQLKFVVKVMVKVDIFSEAVELLLVNVDQFTNL